MTPSDSRRATSSAGMPSHSAATERLDSAEDLGAVVDRVRGLFELEGQAIGPEWAEIGVRVVVGEVHLGLGELWVSADEVVTSLDDSSRDAGQLGSGA